MTCSAHTTPTKRSRRKGGKGSPSKPAEAYDDDAILLELLLKDAENLITKLHDAPSPNRKNHNIQINSNSSPIQQQHQQQHKQGDRKTTSQISPTSVITGIDNYDEKKEDSSLDDSMENVLKASQALIETTHQHPSNSSSSSSSPSLPATPELVRTAPKNQKQWSPVATAVTKNRSKTATTKVIANGADEPIAAARAPLNGKWEKVKSAQEGDDDYVPLKDYSENCPKHLTGNAQGAQQHQSHKSRLEAYRRRRQAQQKIVSMTCVGAATILFLVGGAALFHQHQDPAEQTLQQQHEAGLQNGTAAIQNSNNMISLELGAASKEEEEHLVLPETMNAPQDSQEELKVGTIDAKSHPVLSTKDTPVLIVVGGAASGCSTGDSCLPESSENQTLSSPSLPSKEEEPVLFVQQVKTTIPDEEEALNSSRSQGGRTTTNKKNETTRTTPAQVVREDDDTEDSMARQKTRGWLQRLHGVNTVDDEEEDVSDHHPRYCKANVWTRLMNPRCRDTVMPHD